MQIKNPGILGVHTTHDSERPLITEVTKSVTKLFGGTSVVERSFYDLIDPSDRERVELELRKAYDEQRSQVIIEFTLTYGSVSQRVIDVICLQGFRPAEEVSTGSAGTMLRMDHIMTPIEAVDRSRQALALDIVRDLDVTTFTVDVREKSYLIDNLWGEGRVAGNHVIDMSSLLGFCHRDHRQRIETDLALWLADRQPRYSFDMPCGAGRQPSGCAHVRLLKMEDPFTGKVTWLQGYMVDTTEHWRANESLHEELGDLRRQLTDKQSQLVIAEKQARQDALTGLPNRAGVDELLGVLLGAARRRSEDVAVVFMDLNKFKPVNDQYGHSAGDQVLRKIGERVRQLLRGSEDVFGRIGGDEFAFGLVVDPQRIDALLHKIQRAVSAPITISVGQDKEERHLQVAVDASFGIAFTRDHGYDLANLLQLADAAMYEAKESDAQYVIAEIGSESVSLHLGPRVDSRRHQPPRRRWYDPRGWTTTLRYLFKR